MCLKSIKGDIRHLEFSKCPILSKSQLLMWWVTFPTIKRTRIQLTSCFEVALVTYFLWLKLWGDLTINRFHSLKPWFAKDWKRANGWMSKSCAKEMVIILSSVGFENSKMGHLKAIFAIEILARFFCSSVIVFVKREVEELWKIW